MIEPVFPLAPKITCMASVATPTSSLRLLIFVSPFLKFTSLRPLYLLFGDPVPYVRRTMKQLDAFPLATREEANYVQIHQTYFVQVQRDCWSAVLHLRLQCF